MAIAAASTGTLKHIAKRRIEEALRETGDTEHADDGATEDGDQDDDQDDAD